MPLKEVNKQVSAYGKLYFTSSDFSLRDKNRAYIMLYNPDIGQNHGLPNLFDVVKEGKWTIDLMTEYADIVDGEVDGNGEMDPYVDNYGLGMDSCNAFAAFLYGCDNMCITKDAEDAFIMTMNNEHMINSIDKVLKLTDPNLTICCGDVGDWDVSFVAFTAERSMCTCCFPHSLKSASAQCEFDYWILPYPKFDEAQSNYYTMADIFTMLFGIPLVCKDASFSGFMLEALSAASTDTSLRAYYDVSCKTKYSYNETNGEMLDLIFEGIRFEPALIYDLSNLYNVISDLPCINETNMFASWYKRGEKIAEKTIKSIAEQLIAQN